MKKQGGKLARPDSCANCRVIPASHICLPKALRLQLPTLNLREQQSTKAIFSAGLKAGVQAGKNEVRALVSVKIRQQLWGLCSWKKDEVSHCPEMGTPGWRLCCRNVTGGGGWR